MHTKLIAERRVLTFLALACLARPLLVSVYLLRLILPTPSILFKMCTMLLPSPLSLRWVLQSWRITSLHQTLQPCNQPNGCKVVASLVGSLFDKLEMRTTLVDISVHTSIQFNSKHFIYPQGVLVEYQGRATMANNLNGNRITEY